ncbi:MAG: NAD-dependent protein deacylase [Coriobacteriia bacterium]|nr:NAD-dependent protein deacylase [Coriobacteriia bacterium]
MDTVTQLANWLKASENCVFFGGAGVSTESGIPDFRSEKGLFATKEVYGFSPEEILSYTVFMNNPSLFFRYYKENLIAMDARPNKAHQALAALEAWGKLKAVITQNVDGLHQAAGSHTVYELHGSNWRQYCIECGTGYSLAYILDEENCKEGVPYCQACSSIVRPAVVLYEEPLDMSVMNASIAAIEAADMLIVGGTSLAVYPAAGLLHYFKGERLVLINKSPTAYDGLAQLVINDSIGEVLDSVVSQLLA